MGCPYYPSISDMANAFLFIALEMHVRPCEFCSLIFLSSGPRPYDLSSHPLDRHTKVDCYSLVGPTNSKGRALIFIMIGSSLYVSDLYCSVNSPCPPHFFFSKIRNSLSHQLKTLAHWDCATWHTAVFALCVSLYVSDQKQKAK